MFHAPLPEASVQLYTLAGQFSQDPRGSLEKLAALGLRNVEAFDFVRRPAEIRQALDAAGLSSPTGHAPLLSDELWTPDGSIPAPSPEKVFEAAATVGIGTVIDPFVPVSRWLTADGVADIAERLNRASEVAAGFGLAVGYHNHAQEFLADFNGTSAFEHFVSLVDEKVELELDLYWAATGDRTFPRSCRASETASRQCTSRTASCRRATPSPPKRRRSLHVRSTSDTLVMATFRWWKRWPPAPATSGTR